MSGKGVKQVYVTVRGIRGLPAEPPYSHIVEQAGRLDLRAAVRQRLRRMEHGIVRLTLPDFVVHVLNIEEERVEAVGKRVSRSPERQVPARLQNPGGQVVPLAGRDPVP
jgi:hypothetical protein